MSTAPKVGDKAPDFTLPADGGKQVALTDLRKASGMVVLYFYPKDDTSGCTREAIEFSQALAKFKRAGAAVVGLSKDSVAKHDRFKDKHGLKVTLVSDDDGSVCERYGVWVEKTLYGRKYMGIDRATFVIDKKGVIRNLWRKVKVPGHVEEVLAAVKELA